MILSVNVGFKKRSIKEFTDLHPDLFRVAIKVEGLWPPSLGTISHHPRLTNDQKGPT